MVSVGFNKSETDDMFAAYYDCATELYLLYDKVKQSNSFFML
jgi:hypothetical protein